MKRFLLSFGIFALAGSALFFLASFTGNDNSKGANTPGNLTFTVRTVSAGGNYAPKHVLAIWIEHNNTFVKTRKAMANQRKQYLYTWKAASNYNVVDAITGPTLTSHTTHTVTWDCTDLDGNIVEDGHYVVWVEFTDKHAQGPLYNIDFMKGPDPQSANPPDETYFKDISLEFTPVTSQFEGTPTEICQGETVTFTDMSSGATSWEWEFGEGASPATASTQGPHTVTYNSNGPKSVSLTVNGVVTETKANYIVVYPVPTAGFTYETNGLTATFTNTSANATSYLWDFGDGNTSTENNPEYTYSEPGTYTVTLTAEYIACTDETSQDITVNVVGTDEISDLPGIEVFPNPSDGVLFINTVQSVNSKVRIFDAMGNEVEGLNPTLQSGNGAVMIDLSTHPKGLYLVEVTVAGERKVVKTIVQ